MSINLKVTEKFKYQCVIPIKSMEWIKNSIIKYVDTLADFGEQITNLVYSPIDPILNQLHRGYIRPHIPLEDRFDESDSGSPTGKNLSLYEKTVGLPFYYVGTGTRKFVDITSSINPLSK